ncbi:DUF2285 domain-containing protein [Sphingomonas cannabina]|uniref:DUF2285 domain-containing protein n=1 Tax=Sphingomonas cannabina TaxID=2899123 RepID=UPI001F4621FC|nr:DUF2285 domain-containing protein [Sphingomonas cannabina]UIJ44788.1 DUF2285 domain-containing protein [Sphingomonas cannabina]
MAAPEARLIWRADLDPAVLRLEAVPTSADDPERVEPSVLRGWLVAVSDGDGIEHAVLTDGKRRIRLEVDGGTLLGDRPVLLRYRLSGVRRVAPPLLALRRFLHLYRHRRFPASLFPPDRQAGRWIAMLRVHDALADGASQREIAEILVGRDRVATEWRGDSESLRSRVRRLVADARRMARGDYLALMVRGCSRARKIDERPGA